MSVAEAAIPFETSQTRLEPTEPAAELSATSAMAWNVLNGILNLCFAAQCRVLPGSGKATFLFHRCEISHQQTHTTCVRFLGVVGVSLNAIPSSVFILIDSQYHVGLISQHMTAMYYMRIHPKAASSSRESFRIPDNEPVLTVISGREQYQVPYNFHLFLCSSRHPLSLSSDIHLKLQRTADTLFSILVVTAGPLLSCKPRLKRISKC
jgi:hypothetical protein